MAYMCENCGKTLSVGRTQRHGRGVAGKRWRKRAQKTVKIIKPNIQKIGVLVDGKKVSLNLCTSCIRRFKKDGKLGFYSSVSAS